MVDVNDMFHIAKRIDIILEAMYVARRLTIDEKLQIKRVLDVALDQWFDEDE